jgi:glucans biosynthesis protein
MDFAYRMHWQGATQQRPPSAWTVQSRTGSGYGGLAADERQFIVDFAGASLDKLPPDATVKAVVSVGATGKLVESNAYKNEANGLWRMTVRVKRLDAKQPVELRAFLQHTTPQTTHALTETWTTIIQPD